MAVQGVSRSLHLNKAGTLQLSKRHFVLICMPHSDCNTNSINSIHSSIPFRWQHALIWRAMALATRSQRNKCIMCDHVAGHDWWMWLGSFQPRTHLSLHLPILDMGGHGGLRLSRLKSVLCAYACMCAFFFKIACCSFHLCILCIHIILFSECGKPCMQTCTKKKIHTKAAVAHTQKQHAEHTLMHQGCQTRRTKQQTRQRRALCNWRLQCRLLQGWFAKPWGALLLCRFLSPWVFFFWLPFVNLWYWICKPLPCLHACMY